MKQSERMDHRPILKKTALFVIRFIGIVMVMVLLNAVAAPQEMMAVQITGPPPGVTAMIHNVQPIPDTIVTCKLTVTGGGTPLPPKPPFPPVTIVTCSLTITGGGTPPPPKPPFPGVTITTPRLTISGTVR